MRFYENERGFYAVVKQLTVLKFPVGNAIKIVSACRLADWTNNIYGMVLCRSNYVLGYVSVGRERGGWGV